MSSRMSLSLACFTVVFLSLASITVADDVSIVSSGDTLTGMTITELAKFDGKDGRKAYVAVDSIIYDVTGVKAWKGGKHKGNKAGKDVTAKIAKAPHGKTTLKKLNKVGKLIPTASEPATADTKN